MNEWVFSQSLNVTLCGGNERLEFSDRVLAFDIRRTSPPVQDQLGLRLESRKVSVPIFVIDH
jgi:Protein of unknown function (DUF3738)